MKQTGVFEELHKSKNKLVNGIVAVGNKKHGLAICEDYGDGMFSGTLWKVALGILEMPPG